MDKPSTADFAKLHVLLADDNMMTIKVTTSLLEEFGFVKVDVATNGREAIDKIQEAQEKSNPYDIVFLDWNMPEVSGYDVLRQCRDDINLSKMAIVMITAENQRRNILEATKAGATSYIIKPVIKDDFFQKISQVLDWKYKNQSVA